MYTAKYTVKYTAKPLMPIARSLAATRSLAAARCSWAVFALALLLAAADRAQAGLIVGAQDGNAGFSVPDEPRGPSPTARSDSTEDHVRDLACDGALPTGTGSSSSTTSTTAGSLAVLPPPCGLPAPALSAGLCEERALRLPESPFFDHLRPPQG